MPFQCAHRHAPVLSLLTIMDLRRAQGVGKVISDGGWEDHDSDGGWEDHDTPVMSG
jgi:hypothetical protein